MSISNLYPSIRPSMSMDFANTKVLPPTVTFSRASSATYFDANGVMKTAPSGVARFDHDPRPTLSGTGTVSGSAITLPTAFADGSAPLARDDAYNGMAITVAGSPFTVTDYVGSTRVATLSGTPTTGSQAFTLQNPNMGESLGLLIEEARTNLLTYSERFDDAAWTKSPLTMGVSANAVIAPDGTLTAEKLVESASSGLQALLTTTSTTVTIGGTYTMSVFVKAAERSIVRVADASSGGLGGANFNLATRDITNITAGITNPTITDVGNGWFRCACTMVANDTGITTAVWVRNADNTSSYTGDGTSGIYIWGAQLEAGSHPTSYIKTEGAQATRNADVASMTGANFSSWYRQDEGTFVLNATQQAVTKGQHNGLVFDGGSSLFYTLNVSSTLRSYDGTNTVSSGSIVANTPFAAALGYSSAGMAQSFNGATPGTSSFDGSFGSSSFYIGSTGYNTIQGHIHKITYYPKRLTDANLQALTA